MHGLIILQCCYNSNQRKTETSLHKKDSKKKKSSCCRDGSMNAMADKVHKQEVPCTVHSDDVQSISWPHYSTTIPIHK